MPTLQKITPFFWFDQNAEEAVKHYLAIFKDSKILATSYYGEAGPGPADTVRAITFQLEGQEFIALNGGPLFKFNEAISLVINCDSQQEIDAMWAKLSAGGTPGRCGWLRDKFGLSWQVVPSVLAELLQDPDPVRSQRVMQTLMEMHCLDIAELQRAHRGK